MAPRIPKELNACRRISRGQRRQQASGSALVTSAAETKWLNGWSAGAAFEGEFSAVTVSYAGKGVVRYVVAAGALFLETFEARHPSWASVQTNFTVASRGRCWVEGRELRGRRQLQRSY